MLGRSVLLLLFLVVGVGGCASEDDKPSLTAKPVAELGEKAPDFALTDANFSPYNWK